MDKQSLQLQEFCQIKSNCLRSLINKITILMMIFGSHHLLSNIIAFKSRIPMYMINTTDLLLPILLTKEMNPWWLSITPLKQNGLFSYERCHNLSKLVFWFTHSPLFQSSDKLDALQPSCPVHLQSKHAWIPRSHHCSKAPHPSP